jgi:Rps23 Pro-64 3,4-dihydroxylase Tpa1-like proline 4-hydroxylase
MSERELRLGIFGTFDVANYGDLLFPLIAEAELSRRLGSLTLCRFSYHEKSPPSWPYAVRSLTRLPEDALDLDGAIIGGGHIIRFDKQIAPGYYPPSPGIHHPTGYWLTPALVARDGGLPVVWNAPGVHGAIPPWAESLVALAIQGSAYVSVRDEPSRRALEPLAGNVKIHVVPDTAFGLARLVDVHHPSAEFLRLHAELGANRPYIIVQATSALSSFARFVRKHAPAFVGHRLLAVPVCPIHGDDAAVFDYELPDMGRLQSFPTPLVLAELIAHASAVVGVSLHLSISALAFGVPLFRPAGSFSGKYATLSGHEGVHELDPEGGVELSKLTALRSGAGQAPTLELGQLSVHWDQIAAHLAERKGASHRRAANDFWSKLPALLEGSRTPTRLSLIQVGTALVKGLAARPEQLYHRASRQLPRRLSHLTSLSDEKRTDNVIDLQRIERGTLATQPYEWAFIDGLFSPEHATALSASFPRDSFKTVRGHDGEKGYAYEARALIPMGAEAPAHLDGLSSAWRQLADDLLSPDYRGALAQLLRRELGSFPMEVNVFRYPPRAWLGPHIDLKDKLITHVFYFNDSWNEGQGGCLNVLRSPDMADAVAKIAPLIGHSALLVRSERSWHAVSPVVDDCAQSRLSMTVTFYRPGSVSTLWPPGDKAPLHRCEGATRWGTTRASGLWASLSPRIAARLKSR